MKRNTGWVLALTAGVLAVLYVWPMVLVFRNAHLLDRPEALLQTVAADPNGAITIRTVRVGAAVAVLSILLAVPAAYVLSKVPPRARTVGIVACLVPLLLNLLVITLAWHVILEPDGVVNDVLRGAGLVDRPVRLLFAEASSYAGMVYAVVPALVLVVYQGIAGVSRSTVESARLLGASRLRTAIVIELGQARPAILTALFMGFLIGTNLYLVAEYLTGPKLTTLGYMVHQSVIGSFDLETAASLAVGLIAIVAIPAVALLTIGRSQRSS